MPTAGRYYSPGRMLGFNNRLPQSRLATTDDQRAAATYLSAADNVDMQRDGFVRRRRGYKLAVAGALCHSLWTDGDEGFYIDGSNLVHLRSDLSTQVLRTDMAPQLRVSFARLGDGSVAYTNGVVLGRVRGEADGKITADPPAVTPTITATSGSLPAGRYLVCFTRISPDGESATTPVEQIELPEGSGIAITNRAADVLTYMSQANGDVLTLADNSNPIVVQPVPSGARCQTIGLAPIPAGQIVRCYGGQMLVAAGSVLYISEPYRYGLYRPGRNFILFPARITVLEPLGESLFVCADQTYRLEGDVTKSALQTLLPFGGLAGSGVHSDDGERIFWQSPNGIVSATADGTVETPQHAAIAFGSADAGALLYRRQDGATHVLGVRTDTGPSVGAGSSWMDAEVLRKGTVL